MVVADGLGGGDALGDVLVGDVLDEPVALGGGGPHAGVAVGLQLQADGVGVGALLGADPAHGAEQVLDVVAVLVGEHVGAYEGGVLAAELLEDGVEEGRVEVDGLVGGAVERPDGARRGAAAAGLDLVGEDDHRLLGLEPAGEVGLGVPVAGQRVLQRDERAVLVVVGVLAGLAGPEVAGLAAVGRLEAAEGAGADRGRAAVAAEDLGADAGALGDEEEDQQHDDGADAAARLAAGDRDPGATPAAEPAAATSAGGPAGVESGLRVEPHLCPPGGGDVWSRVPRPYTSDGDDHCP